MTAKEFWEGGFFTLDFLSQAEKETIIKATELYAKGKVREYLKGKLRDDPIEGYYPDIVITDTIESWIKELEGKSKLQQ